LYASQLVFTQARFYKASRLPNLQFAWSNTFDASPQTNTDIRFEQAAVLYNIAAVACNLAQQRFKGSETDEQDLKQSLKWYKTAAQAATSLLSLVPELGLTGDLSLAAISVLQPLLAAQTYECSLVKAIKAGMKPATIARIATQIASLYDQAHTAVLPLPVGKTHPWQAWQPCLQAKTLRARGLAQYYQSKFSEASSEWGEEVARLRLAVELLRNVEQAIPQGRDAIVDISSLKPLLSEVQARLTKAEDDNNVIYHEAVPSETALVEVTAVELFSIGPLGMQESVDMLSTLLPLEAHLAASELSEAKSQLLRKAQHDVSRNGVGLQSRWLMVAC
jgi:programmed cell death 6-interacting protein